MLILALAVGVLLTAVATAIGGLAVELILFALSRSLIAQTGHTNAINFKRSEKSGSAVGLAERAA